MGTEIPSHGPDRSSSEHAPKRDEVLKRFEQLRERRAPVRSELIGLMLQTHEVPGPPSVDETSEHAESIRQLQRYFGEVARTRAPLIEAQRRMKEGYPPPEDLADSVLFYRRAVDVYEYNYIVFVRPSPPPEAFQGLLMRQVSLIGARQKVLTMYDEKAKRENNGLISDRLTVKDRTLIQEYLRTLKQYRELCEVGKKQNVPPLPTLPDDAPAELHYGIEALRQIRSRTVELRGKVVERNELTGIEHDELVRGDRTLARGLELVEEFKEDPDAYAESVRVAKTDLLKSWELPVSTGMFSRLVEEATQQPRRLPTARKSTFTEQQWGLLGQARQQVVSGVDTFQGKYGELLFRHQTGMPVDPERNQECLELFVQLLMKHETYERALYPKGDHPPTYWFAALAVFAQEMAEEYAEAATEEAGVSPTQIGRRGLRGLPAATRNNLFSLVKQPPSAAASAADVVKTIPGIDKAPKETRRLLEQGIKDAQRIMRAQGGNMTAAEFREIMKNARLGEGFVQKLLPEMGATTYVFYAMYMAQSPDKVKAALGLATFVIGGNLFSAVAIDGALVRGAQMAGAKFGMPALARFRGVPAPVKIAAIIGFMLWRKEDVAAFVEWLDEKYPASHSKRALGAGLGAFFVDEAFSSTDERLYDNGVLTVDPERDWMRYLAREHSKVTDPSVLFSEGRTFVASKDDWNKRVRQAIDKEPSQIKKARYALEFIDEGWVKRQAHDVFTQLSYMKILRKQLEESLGDNAAVSASDRSDAHHAFIDIITSQEHKRNDVMFDIYLAGNSNHTFAGPSEDGPGKNMYRMQKLIEGLEEEEKRNAPRVAELEKKIDEIMRSAGGDESRIENKEEFESLQREYKEKSAAAAARSTWQEYVGVARNIAKKITLIKRMKFPGSDEALSPGGGMYDRDTWFGDTLFKQEVPRLPPFIAQGLARQVLHLNDKRRAEKLVNIDRYIATSEAVNELGTVQTRPLGRRGHDHRRPSLDD